MEKEGWTTPSATAPPAAISAALRSLERRVASLDRAVAHADWALYTGRSRSSPVRWQIARARLLGAEGLLEWSEEAQRRVDSPLDCRRLELIRRAALIARLENPPAIARLRGRLLDRLVAMRPRWKGRRRSESEIWELGRQDTNAARRRQAFYAATPFLRPLEAELRELIQLRNDQARSLGFRTYAEARLGVEGLSPSAIEGFVEALEPRLRALARSARDRFREKLPDVPFTPWNWSHLRWRDTAEIDRSFPARRMLGEVLGALRRWGFRPAQLRFRIDRVDLPSAGMT
ncbi:MAG: hypothetical protein L3J91_04830, partial [Thermoplasmata archaeon]|nr:hypothetical protein [Thermoplasmata archaeon]